MNQYKDFKLPSLRGDFSYARLSTNKKTEDKPLEDLRQGFTSITGADEYFNMMSVNMTEGNMRKLLHVSILTANEHGQPEGQDLRVS